MTKTHFKIAEKDELYISYYDNHQIKQLKRNYADTLEETVNYSKKGVVEYFENRYKRAKPDKSFLSDSTVIYDSNYTVRSVDVHNMTKWIRFNYDKKSKLIQVIDFVKLSRLPPDRIMFEGSMRKMGKNQQAWFIRDSLKGDTYLDEKVKFIWVYPFGVCKSITRLN